MLHLQFPASTEKIKKELVETNYYRDVKYNLASKSRWKIVGDVSEAFANILIVLTSILAFSAGVFNYILLSFIAGCFGTLSLALLRFSSYSMMESRERTQQVNLLLQNLGIDSIVDITIDSTGNFANNRRKEIQMRKSKEIDI